jgi:hypothetical protein
VAESSGGKFGGILGLIIGGVLVVGLAGSPFYLGMLQSPDRQADRSASKDVEDVRRIVLGLDAHLAAIGDAGRGSNPGGTDGNKGGTIPPDMKATIDQTTKLLQETEQADRTRGTVISGKMQIQSGAPNLRSASSEMKSKYAAAHEKLLSEADQKLRTISGGGDSLSVNRMKSIVEYARGRLLRNRAEFEHWQARTTRDAAMDLSTAIATLKSTVASLEGQTPTAAIRAVEGRIGKISQDAKTLKSDADKLSDEIAGLKEKLAEQDKVAADAQEKMAAMTRAAKGTLSADYQRLSDEYRKAVAEAGALTNGALDNGTLVENKSADIVPPEYQGGTARSGIRDLEIALADLNARAKAMGGLKKGLEENLAALKELGSKLEEQKSQASGKLEEQSAEAKKLLAEADARDQAAATAETGALKAFAEAGRAAKQAANAAKTRANDARTASTARGGAVPDERLTRVSSEGDTEGSMYCLAGECAYYAALTHASRIAALENAQLASGEKSAGGVDEARSAAVKLINESLDSYKKAADAISKTKAGTIVGRNYLWQVQVAQAAATLLRANLAETIDAGGADRAAAYKLLAEAAKGKEQSPLLTPAIDTLVYLQESSK